MTEFHLRPFGIGCTFDSKEEAMKTVKDIAYKVASFGVGVSVIAIAKSLTFTADMLSVAAEVVADKGDGFIRVATEYCEKSTPVAIKTNAFLHGYAMKKKAKQARVRVVASNPVV